LTRLEPIFTRSFTLLMVGTVAEGMTNRMSGPIIPLYMEDMGSSVEDVGLVMGLLAIVLVISRLPFGRLVDGRRKKYFIMLGALVLAAGLFGFAFANNTTELMFFRVVQGIGLGAYQVGAIAMVIGIAPQSRLGEALGYYGAAVTGATAAGPAIAGFLADFLGFSPTFVLIACLAVLAFAIVGLVREGEVQPRDKAHGLGEVFRDYNVRTSCLAVFFTFLTYGTIIAFLPLHLSALGVEAWGVGAFFTVFAMAAVVTRPTLGKLSDSRGRVPIIIPTMAFAFAGLLAVTFSGDLLAALVSAALYGFGFSGAMSALIALNVDTVHPTNRGTATAFYMMFCDSGVAVGSIALAPVAASMGYLHAIWLSALLLLFALVVFSLLRWRPSRRAGQTRTI